MSKKKKTLPVIEVPASGVSNWSGGAYTLSFVYSNKGNFLVKGYLREVEDYIKKNFPRYFVNHTLWKKDFLGRSIHRSIWKFWKDGVYVTKPDRRSRSKKWKFTYFSPNQPKLEFKRLPKSWIPELNKF